MYISLLETRRGACSERRARPRARSVRAAAYALPIDPRTWKDLTFGNSRKKVPCSIPKVKSLSAWANSTTCVSTGRCLSQRQRGCEPRPNLEKLPGFFLSKKRWENDVET